MPTTNTQINRSHSFDTLRTLSAAMVVLIHCAAVYAASSGGDFVFANLVNSFSRVAVPLFVMTSGAFLLGRDETPAVFYRKRFGKIFIPLAVWSAVGLTAWGARSYVETGAVDFGRLLSSVAHGDPFYHLWYLYMSAGLYAVAPFLNVLIRQSPVTTLWAVAWFMLLAACLNDCHDYFHAGGSTALPTPGTFVFKWVDYFGYFLLGYLIRTRSPRRFPPTMLIGAYVLSSLMIAYMSQVYEMSYFYRYLSPFVMAGALCVFKLFCQYDQPQPGLASRLAPYSFGIYLIHAFLLTGAGVVGLPPDSAYAGIPMLFALGWGGGLLASWMLSKIGYLRRVV